MNDDDRLKEGFAKLRADDARRAPPFEAMWRARPKRSPWRVVVPAASLTAAAAALLFWCKFEQSASAPQSSVVAVAPAAALPPLPVVQPEPSSLDFLLDLPMGASLAKVPDFDKTLLVGKAR